MNILTNHYFMLLMMMIDAFLIKINTLALVLVKIINQISTFFQLRPKLKKIKKIQIPDTDCTSSRNTKTSFAKKCKVKKTNKMRKKKNLQTR